MSNSFSSDVERQLLADLTRLSAEREAAERRVHAEFAARNEAAAKEFKATREKLTAKFNADLHRTQSEFDAALHAATAEYERDHQAAADECREIRDRVQEKYAARETETNKQLEQDSWQASTVFEAAHPGLLEQLNRVEARVNGNAEQLNALAAETLQYLEVCRQTPAWEALPTEDRPLAEGDPFKHLPDCGAAASAELATLRSRLAPKMFVGVRPQIFGVVVFVITVALSVALFTGVWYKLAGAAVLSTACITAPLVWIHHRARSQSAAHSAAIRQAMADGEKYKQQCLIDAKAFYESQREKMARRHRRDVRHAHERHLSRMTEIISDRDGALTEADDNFNRREAQLVVRRDAALQAANQKYPSLLAEIGARHERDQAEAQARNERQVEESRARHEAEWNELADRYRSGMEQFYATVAEMQARSQELFPAWDSSTWAKDWAPPTAPPPGIRFGDFTVRLDQVIGGISRDERLKPPGPTTIALPALLPFPRSASMLIQATGEGRNAAVNVLNTVMLRMLTAIPPGKVRFTIIDPVGRGQNFAGFMHLADYDDILVTNRIWTEQQQIEARLADLTEQMENVIQKYLRNDFPTIADYNEFAGEVAEAFRILVVANFPEGFTEAAAQRLTSIAATGARCGVYVLMTTDMDKPLPMRFDLKDVESHSTNLILGDSDLVWKDAGLAQFRIPSQEAPKKQEYRIWQAPSPLQGEEGVQALPYRDSRDTLWIEPGKPCKVLDEFEAESSDEALNKWLEKSGRQRQKAPFALTVEMPPPEERFTQIVQLVGENAKDSRRVEVPFEYIAPADDRWWSGSTSHGINVPLGRAGATKLQHLRLGSGTSQHVLVAGKTGSGKSTLLHALITNLALTYDPGEIELYLIDFKKGVEFKTYATHELPHARVIAIESEREFGLSVLQSLDTELRRRGDMFRNLGVQDLASFRQEQPGEILPRILLVVDEFQELFVEDDKIGQDAALLLDRLVRQGRAFGIHVMLGSQTLGGAYSLARSTIGQMAVRIALQCSENDAHLILSEDNSAARLLSRPGEAIYNDANGMIIGNNPFQVVWLSDERREKYLIQLRQRARDSNPPWKPKQIVFEGNVPADVGRNRLLVGLLSADRWTDTGLDPRAWLGEAIAIKDPTAAVFRRQNGCNLVIIGQRDEAARGIMATAMVSLAAQTLPLRPREGGPATLPLPLGEGRGEGGALNNGSVFPGNGHKRSSEAKFYLLEPMRSAERPGPTLAQLADVLPHPVRVAGRRDVPEIINELAEEVARRQSEDHADSPAIYLFIYDVGRFRDLRRGDDFASYSFSGDSKPVSPGVQFSDILREGPAVGVYTIAWCDTLNNFQRTVDRQGMREFDLRVLFQMSATDSSQLIDTPLASRLGPNLGLFFNEEEGKAEKFRPYAWPEPDWLAWAHERLQSRLARHDGEPAAKAVQDA